MFRGNQSTMLGIKCGEVGGVELRLSGTTAESKEKQADPEGVDTS